MKARERLHLCRAMLDDIIIDWEILRDEGIVVKEFDRLVNETLERLAIEIDHVELVWQRDPRMGRHSYQIFVVCKLMIGG